jgi:nitrate/nitrite-specific signal transduction histidine kinase
MIKVIVKTTPKFEMQIMDDGIGFDAMKKTNKLSLGLLTMNDRAASINYYLSMESASGKGTKITLTEKKT